MFRLRRPPQLPGADTGLYDQDTFYRRFIYDLRNANNEVVIESPFITERRMDIILPELARLTKRGVKVIVNTKPSIEHDGFMQEQAEAAVASMQSIGVEVLLTVGHHRKLAVIDRAIVWEGSLNILSQYDSCEIMRRLQSEQLASQLLSFIKLTRFLA